MAIRIKAVYENGLIRPEGRLTGVAEHERLDVTIEKDRERLRTPDEILELCGAIFDGLDADQIKVVESARLRRLRNSE
ncbi:MAG: antitoxin AF2212-like protein [Vitreimonas sp.]